MSMGDESKRRFVIVSWYPAGTPDKYIAIDNSSGYPYELDDLFEAKIWNNTKDMLEFIKVCCTWNRTATAHSLNMFSYQGKYWYVAELDCKPKPIRFAVVPAAPELKLDL